MKDEKLRLEGCNFMTLTTGLKVGGISVVTGLRI